MSRQLSDLGSSTLSEQAFCNDGKDPTAAKRCEPQITDSSLQIADFIAAIHQGPSLAASQACSSTGQVVRCFSHLQHSEGACESHDTNLGKRSPSAKRLPGDGATVLGGHTVLDSLEGQTPTPSLL
ncbi:hypothetical protein BaRGS_00008252 [Batillaria attramentaria]|uniref:Uncharacterized protein n=1 Tax=Batillaria attramentaria TaxID=370345 RepID=A0ABD0LLH2_9CAEN